MSDLIKEFEGYVPHPYFCPANKLTFGWGHVITTEDVICGQTASKIYSYAQSIKSNDMKSKNKLLKEKFEVAPHIALNEAQRLFDMDTIPLGHRIRDLIKVPVNKNQFDAILSLVYNIGFANFKTSTLLRKLNAGDYVGASEEFERWNKMTVGGKKVVSEGLTRRREAEARLFNEPIKKVT